ncbi:hypothetical protein [Pectobacterium punjabense]|uniref:hypothetical protein n=1 Tax=Pectobacterium punjabense TaxID=2108399 RepID=UPI0019693A86|nr:hypothetical protein [Pectobacterium punjabense]MBN3136140.1 hypothetical protein [Pectobacterium punjabense]MCE5378807.1 hypothetical protein [Pectobacterium punjabense]
MISILFGAGASFGSENGHPAPPLGDALFDALDSLGGAYSKLTNEQKINFREHGFEIGMLTIPNNSVIINPLQNELAIYLSSFHPSKDSAYIKLFKMLGDKTKKINILTLNYDLLIEESLIYAGNKFVQYGVFDNEISVLKVHGSSNFIPHISGLIGNMVAIDCGSFVETNQMKILNNHEEINAWCKSSHAQSLSPVMCMYNKEKRAVINNEMLNSFRGEYNKAILSSDFIVIIGVKFIPHDNHIWDSIMSSDIKLIIVDPYPSDLFIDTLREMKIEYILIKKPFHRAVTRLSGIIRSKLRKQKKFITP